MGKLLRSQLNQVRAWVRQGRTDAWIAHQLESTAGEVAQFKKQHDLASQAKAAPPPVALETEDLDLTVPAEQTVEQADEDAEGESREEAPGGDGEAEKPPAKPKRRRRSSRSKTKADQPRSYEATFEHGDEGYGLWLDPSVEDDPLYKQKWAGHRPVKVTLDAEKITIERA